MHYICVGECHGLSDTPGVCQAEDCSEQGQPLHACHCKNGDHDWPARNIENQEEKDLF